MSNARSYLDENGGRCEGCSEPGSEYRTQTAAPVLLGGGIGWGTMYLCPKCADAYCERHAAEDGACGDWVRRFLQTARRDQ